MKFPEGMSFEEASTLPCAGVTAWVGLMVLGGLKAGETVLAMGTGGVSIFALQLAKASGARVILTSGHDEKLARGKAVPGHRVVMEEQLAFGAPIFCKGDRGYWLLSPELEAQARTLEDRADRNRQVP